MSRATPYVVDTALAIAVALPLSAPFMTAAPGQVTPLGVALNVATVVPLVWRRRWPAAVAVIVTVSGCLVSLYHRPGQSLQYAGLVAIYTIADWGRPWQRRAFLATVLLTFPPASLLVKHDNAADFVFSVGLPLVAYLLGTLARATRAQRDAVFARNAEIERSRHLDAARARAEERTRISRDMHDILAHAVAVMVVQAEAGPVVVRSDPDRAIGVFEAIADAGRAAADQLSRVLGVLKDQSHPGVPPQPTTADIAALLDIARRAGVAVELRTVGTPRTLAPDAELAVYRLVQEALTNAVKHAVGAAATVHLEWRDDLRVTVTDTGGPSAAYRPVGGHGLRGIRERVAACGGTVDAGATADGFRVHARIPVPG